MPKLMEWYENQMSGLKELPIMKFFNKKRVHTIHKGVVKPMKQILPIEDLKINGILQAGQGAMVVWQFEDMENFIPGSSGNVFRLCEEYFRILRSLVEEWCKKRKELGII
jgi:hypothetical protein